MTSKATVASSSPGSIGPSGRSPKSSKALANGEPHWPAIDADKAIPWVEQRTKLALADSQQEAVRVALASMEATSTTAIVAFTELVLVSMTDTVPSSKFGT